MHTCVHAEDVTKSHVVFGIKGGLVGKHLGRTCRSVHLGLVACNNLHCLHFWTEHMVGVVAAEADFVVGQGRIVEVDFGRQVVDARLVGHVEFIFDGSGAFLIMINILFCDTHTKVVAVLSVVDRGIHEELLRHDMIPTQGSYFVAPFPVHVEVVLILDFTISVVFVFYAEIDGVVARVETQIESVLVGDLPVEFAVEVVEIIASLQLVDFLQLQLGNPEGGFHQQVAVGTAEGKVE